MEEVTRSQQVLQGQSRYIVLWVTKRKRLALKSEPLPNLGSAVSLAEAKMPSARVVTILKEDTGEFCAENKGKYFLYLIL